MKQFYSLLIICFMVSCKLTAQNNEFYPVNKNSIEIGTNLFPENYIFGGRILNLSRFNPGFELRFNHLLTSEKSITFALSHFDSPINIGTYDKVALEPGSFTATALRFSSGINIGSKHSKHNAPLSSHFNAEIFLQREWATDLKLYFDGKIVKRNDLQTVIIPGLTIGYLFVVALTNRSYLKFGIKSSLAASITKDYDSKDVKQFFKTEVSKALFKRPLLTININYGFML